MSARGDGRGGSGVPVYILVLFGVLALVVLGVVFPMFARSRKSARKASVTAPGGFGAAADQWPEYRAETTGLGFGGRGGARGTARAGSIGGGAEGPPGLSAEEQAGFEGAGEWPVPSEPMLIRTASLRLRVSDVGEAHEEVARIAREAEGYVADTTFSAEAGPSRATVTIRVPSRALDSVMDQIAELGKLLHKQISAQEVTEEYVDLSSRKRNLEREEEQLLALLKRAGKVKDLLEVEQTLARVRGEIERIAGRMRYLENRVSLSTVRVELQGPEPKPTAGGPAWAASDVARQATRSLMGTGRRLATTGIWLGVYTPVWLPIVVVVGLLARRARGLRRPHETNTGS